MTPPVDRESAHEILTARHAEADQAEAEAKAAADKARADALAAKEAEKARVAREKEQARLEREADRRARARAPARRTRETPLEAATKSVLRTAGSTLTREILRGVLGGMRRR